MEKSFCTLVSVRHLGTGAYPTDGYQALPLLGDPQFPGYG